ncbi:MAG: transposase [Flavobacteriales bacterium]|nr:transposase [Flavobacteriales bacterium]MBL0036397.1 transposase [Flavobacteriales bacterium]
MVPTHHDQGTTEGTYFCTATCWDWLPLIERTALYDHIYQWMHLIAAKGCRTLGYVIMPNHLHLLVHVPEGLSINMLLANMKRFAAYEVIKRLQATGDSALLNRLASGVTQGGSARDQKHCVWRTSSDIKPCESERFILQKLDYMHANPVTGKWSLADRSTDYLHSSALFYHTGETQHAPTHHYHDILFGDRASGSLRRP